MSRFCLDTSAYSQFKRGAQAAVDGIAAASWIGIPAIVLGELRTGFLSGTNAERNERELREFLENPIVSILEIDDHAARLCAEILVALRRAGTPIPTNDAWIAAVAAREGATVLTYDAHFQAVTRIGVRVLGGG